MYLWFRVLIRLIFDPLARVVWMERLRRSAVFFGNTGNKYALQKTVDLYVSPHLLVTLKPKS